MNRPSDADRFRTFTGGPGDLPTDAPSYKSGKFTVRTKTSRLDGLYISTAQGELEGGPETPLSAHGRLTIDKDHISFIADDPAFNE